MKVAIHYSENSFADRWIEFCKDRSIPYALVNCYSTDIIEQLKGFDILLWHHHHGNHKDIITAKKILFALEHAGIKVFPNFRTNWHFDDKVAQKYLLEGINAPLVPSFVFYSKKEALEWANDTLYPKVFKLKGGAGAANVKLVRSKNEALSFISKAFKKGFSPFDRWGHLKERYRKYKDGKDSFLGVLKALGRLVIPTDFAKINGREIGYVYFQEFIPNNEFDIRVVVVNNKAFGLKRIIRDNDFRASGSGNIVYNKDEIDISCIKIAFETNKKINAQSIAYDFIFDKNDNPLIVEISYGFAVSAYDSCPGYWTEDLLWHEEKFNPQVWMIENCLQKLINKKSL